LKGNALVVDNEDTIRLMVMKALTDNGYDCSEADGFLSAQRIICKDDFDVLLVDKNMPAENNGEEGGMELIRWVSQNRPDLAVIMMTGHATIDSAVEALKLGAVDYLLKPFSLKLMLQKVERVCEYRRFVSPEAVMGSYLDLNREITQLAGHGSTDMSVCLNGMQERLAHIFQVFHSVERILLEHRQRLAEIAAYVEQALEELPPDHPMIHMLQQIAEKASQRL
jgi:DNA-binding NtrC family response regulator